MKMKTSNRILVATGVASILFVFILLASLKGIYLGDDNSQGPLSGASNIITRTFPVEGFSEISIKGVGRVNLIEGDSFLVNISAPDALMNAIKIEKIENKLVLDSGDDPNRSRDIKYITADITLPTVSRVDKAGVPLTTINLSGLDIDSISIHSEGVVNITGDKGMISNLKFDGTVLSRLDLSTIPVTNADLKCQGAYIIKLLMNGGHLSGSLEGLGTASYEGNVSVSDILVNGSKDKVIHKTKEAASS